MTNKYYPKSKKNKSTNFLDQSQRKTSRKKKCLFSCKYLVYIVIITALVGVILGSYYYVQAKNVYQLSLLGKSYFEAAQNYVSREDFSKASISLKAAHDNFVEAQGGLTKFRFLKVIPIVSQQIVVLEKLLGVGIQTSSALGKITNLATEVMAIIKNDNDTEVSLANIIPEQKREVLEKIYQSPPDLQGAKAEIDLSISTLQGIPEVGLLKPVKQALTPLKENLPTIQNIINQIIPAVQTLPQILGYPEQKTYLFLLQNNTELRPTGGFIGTYGILKIKDGEIVEFETDNIYNLDNQVKETLRVEAPWQLKKYILANHWFMRDSNWSPHFPTSAQKAEWFYHQEGGPESEIDGVVAITPTFIESLLALTGEITVNGVIFNSENVVDTLEYQVEKGFYRQGISESERKEVIGNLADALMNHLLNLPQERWKDLWETFENDVNEKHILIYLDDPNIQDLIVGQNWSGEVKKTSGDYFMVIDANMASLKSDPGVKRTITYNLNLNENKEIIGELSIDYNNEGTFDWKSTRYRSYTRVYVPPGSELIESSGAMQNDKLQGGSPGEVEVLEEEGLTSFGAFIAIEPQESGRLYFKYKLPSSLADKLKNNSYELLVQKQAGTIAHNLVLNLDFGQKATIIYPLDKGRLEGDNKIIFETDLREDRSFKIQF